MEEVPALFWLHHTLIPEKLFAQFSPQKRPPHPCLIWMINSVYSYCKTTMGARHCPGRVDVPEGRVGLDKGLQPHWSSVKSQKWFGPIGAADTCLLKPHEGERFVTLTPYMSYQANKLDKHTGQT